MFDSWLINAAELDSENNGGHRRKLPNKSVRGRFVEHVRKKTCLHLVEAVACSNKPKQKEMLINSVYLKLANEVIGLQEEATR